MGIEVAAGLGVATALLGANEQRKAGKQAKRAANEQSEHLAIQTNEARKQKDVLNAQLEQKKKKIAVGVARAQRGRTRGGLFGDAAETTTPSLTSSLG